MRNALLSIASLLLVDGPGGNLNYPEGFMSKDRRWLHIVFDNNRHQAVYIAAKLPPLP